MTSRIIAVFAIMALSLGLFAGCEREGGQGSETKCTVTGSDTMLNLTKNWAKAYKEKNEGVEISVTGGGSGGGIKALINGTTDFAMASRKIKDKEVEDCKAKGFDVMEHIVAQDGLAVIVHKNNTSINEISMGELKKIFGDKNTKSWKPFNGKDADLVVFTRDSSSGTFVFFLETVIGKKGEYREDSIQKKMQSNGQIIDQVAKTPNGIGYVGLGYAMERKDDIKILKVKKDGGTAYEPGHDNYPLTRNLHYYTKGEPKGLVKKFIEFALSEAGQKIVEKEGFLPLKSN